MNVDPAVIAQMCRAEESLGRRYRLWPWRVWFAVDVQARPVPVPVSPGVIAYEVERQRVYFFRRHFGRRSGGGQGEVRNKRFWSAFRVMLRFRHRPPSAGGRVAFGFSILYTSVALLHVAAESNPLMAAVWMALACMWFDIARRQRTKA